MSRYVFKLPDLGEGTVESEIGAWLVKPGDRITEEQPMVEMMTYKAAVEVPAPASGVVVSLAGQPGDRIAVGAELIVIETSAPDVAAAAATAAAPAAAPAMVAAVSTPGASGRVLTSPAVRRRAQESGVDLVGIAGSGPGGRILQADLESALSAPARGAAPLPKSHARRPRAR